MLQLAGRNEDSEKVFSRLSQEDAGNALWLWYHAVSILNQKRYADAKVPLGRVIDLMDAGKAREDHLAVLRLAHLKMGICDRALAGETEEDAKRRTLLTASRKAMERFVELVPDSVAGRFRLGVVLFEDFGLPHEAMVQLERAHELDPVCEASLRYLIRIATQHGPRPERDPDAAAAARRAWTKKRAAWEQELDEHAQRWAKERERRRVQSPDGTDGCS